MSKIDKHFFFTRLAIDYTHQYNFDRCANTNYNTLYERGETWVRPLRSTPRLKEFSSIEDRLCADIEYWQSTVSKSYENQTINKDFKIYMLYDQKFHDLVHSYSFPDYVSLLGPFDYKRHANLSISPLFRNALQEEASAKNISIHRIDSDDWYRNDFFEYHDNLNLEQGPQPYHLITHNNYIKFNRITNEVTKPLYDHPSFVCSTTYHNFNLDNFSNEKSITDYLPHQDMWTAHYLLHKHQRIINEEVMFLQTIGINLGNEWGDRRRFPLDLTRNPELLNKFNLS